MIWICWNLLIMEFTFVLGWADFISWIHPILMYLSLFFTVYSGMNYVLKNKHMFQN